jgi:hypothetical protein
MAQNQHRRGGAGGSGQGGLTKEHEIAVAVDALKSSFDAYKHTQDENGKSSFRWTRRTTWAAIVYTSLTAALLVASGYVAIKTRDAVDAATRQANIIDGSSKRQLRAYIGVVPGDVVNFGDRENQTFNYALRNFGTTPAYNVFVNPRPPVVIAFGGTIDTVPVIYPNLTGTMTLFPAMDFRRYHRGTNISDEDNKRIKIGVSVKDLNGFQLVYAGIVTYKDVYDELHYTRYCWMFTGASMTSRDAEACLGGNDSN